MRATCGDTHSRLPTGKGVASVIGLAWMRLGSVTGSGSCFRYALIGFAALDELAAVTVGTKYGNAYFGALLPKKASALHA